MKKTALLLLGAALIATSYQCNQPSPQNNGSFEFTVTEDTTFTNLPGLHSFAFGQTDSCWLMLGGRTNGFHGFGSEENFPFKMANKYVYVYNTYTHVLDSMSVDVFDSTLKIQFTSTNMACRQMGNMLYMAGGYGKVNDDTLLTSWQTHGIMTRINVANMVQAVRNHDSAGMVASAVYFTDNAMICTGGELFNLSDSTFYLCVGHNFTGAYSSTSALQVYLDEVRVFKIKQTSTGGIALDGTVQTISDGQSDTTTQFHRRDLVVAPNIGQGGNGYGISIYGGVFTWSPGYPTNPTDTGGNPFRYPIYITGGSNPGYTLDTSYRQMSNVYSAPNLQMYDATNDLVYTTIFGGLGDTSVPGGDSASFTKQILTLKRMNSNGTTTGIYNTDTLPAFVGSEGAFIAAKGVQLYNNNPQGIIDYNNLPTGSSVIGYIYGGILSNAVGWSHSNPTVASNKVYKITVTKN